jgi:hypothetical protein
VRLLARLFLTGALGEHNSKDLLRGLESHIDDFKKTGGQTWEDLCLMAKMVNKVTGTSKDEVFVIESFAKVYLLAHDQVSILNLQVLINSMNLVTPTYDPVGTCLDLIVARFNHACSFNAVVSFDGPALFVRSLHGIKRGEEVTISYIDATNPYAMRQVQLKERYFFTCKCGLCKKGHDTPLDAFLPGDKDTKKLRQLEVAGFQTLELVTKVKDPEQNTRALEGAMAYLRCFPLHRQPYACLRQQLIGTYLSTQRWVDALAHALKQYFHIDPHLFPQTFHPIRVVHNWVLVTLINFIRAERHDEGIKVLEKYNVQWEAVLLMLIKEVVENMGRSHGDGSQFAEIVQTKLRDVTGGHLDISIPKDVVQDQRKRLRLLAQELAPM